MTKFGKSEASGEACEAKSFSVSKFQAKLKASELQKLRTKREPNTALPRFIYNLQLLHAACIVWDVGCRRSKNSRLHKASDGST